MIDVLRNNFPFSVNSLRGWKNQTLDASPWSISRMLPFYVSVAHHLYAKLVYLYLQSIEELQNTNPRIHDLFSNGYHVIRRTDKYCAGLSPDLDIEQELTRTLKTTRTWGRGIKELQRAKYFLSTPSCAAIKSAFGTLTGVYYQGFKPAIEVFQYLMECNSSDKKMNWW